MIGNGESSQSRDVTLCQFSHFGLHLLPRQTALLGYLLTVGVRILKISASFVSPTCATGVHACPKCSCSSNSRTKAPIEIGCLVPNMMAAFTPCSYIVNVEFPNYQTYRSYSNQDYIARYIESLWATLLRKSMTAMASLPCVSSSLSRPQQRSYYVSVRGDPKGYNFRQTTG